MDLSAKLCVKVMCKHIPNMIYDLIWFVLAPIEQSAITDWTESVTKEEQVYDVASRT